MDRLRSVAVIIVLQCVLSGLSIPHKGHHGQHHRHGHNHQDLHVSQKSQTKHNSPKHRTATGVMRESVPTPLQDFVLVSGSPLFHERPRAGDGKTNSTQTPASQTASNEQGQGPLSSQAAEANQAPKQEQKQPGDLSTNSTRVTSGAILEQQQENGPQSTKPGFRTPKEFATAGLSKEGEKEKETTATSTSKEPTVLFTLQGPKNSSLGIQGVSKIAGNTSLSKNVEGGPAFHGSNISIGAAINVEKEKENSEVGAKENQTNTAVDVKLKAQSQQQGAGNFPFNIPGVQNYGNEKSGSKEAETNKQMTDKDLGPNCHWKSTLKEDGKLVTTVSCLGEMKNPEDSKGAMDKGEKIPVIEKGGETIESKQTGAVNVSLAGTGGDGKKIHEQSDKEFEDEALSVTNAFRNVHRALPISLSPELSSQAKEYAEKIASMGSLQHDYDAVRQLDEGENLAMGCKQYGVPLTAKEAITNWYNEVCAYDFDRAEFSMSSGHFTQMVWSDSKEFGIGKASGEQNGMPCTFVVGRFKPSGNYKGEYKRNVFKGNFDPSYCDNLKVKKLL